VKLLLNRVDKNEKRQKRHFRSRKNIFGTAEKPRLNVYRSLSNIYAQIINDVMVKHLFLPAPLKKN
jgi:large subunit ribosomal protein L18